MKDSNQFGGDNYHSVIQLLVQNYMQMLDRVEVPLEKLENRVGRSNGKGPTTNHSDFKNWN